MISLFEKNLEPSESLRHKQINTLSALIHDKWRQSLISKGETRFETTSDEKWITKNNTSEVDLVNSRYEDLPSDRQKESAASAQIAIDEINKAKKSSEELDAAFIEKVSELIHAQWLARNSDSKFSYQDLPYDELSEDEKDKDRNFIREAITLFS